MSKRTGCIGLADAVSPLPVKLCSTNARAAGDTGWTGRGLEIGSVLGGAGVSPAKEKNQTRTGMGWVMASVLATAALSLSCSVSGSEVGPVVGVSSSASMTGLPTTYARSPLSEPLPPMDGWLLVTEEQWKALQAFPEGQRELFACIARAESGFDPESVIVDVDGLPRAGAWMVGATWWGEVPQDLAGQAAQVALIASEHGSRPWTTSEACQ